MEIRHEFGEATCAESFAVILRAIFAEQHPFDQDKEQFYAIGLNTRHAVKYVDLVSIGTLDASILHPREVFRHAVSFGVAKIAIAHNHPSGCIEPSAEDVSVTKQLIKCGELLGIPVMEHLILSPRSSEVLSLRTEKPFLGWT